MTSRPRLIFVLGPTASGKSEIAVRIAEHLRDQGDRGDGSLARDWVHAPPEIINCDSVQFYSGLDIGSAKPGPDLLARARHHLIGHVPLGGDYSAGDFRRDALAVIQTRSHTFAAGAGTAKRAVPTAEQANVQTFIGVGGSGFYIQALEKGMFDVPEIAPGVRESLARELAEPAGRERLHAELATRDPEAASKININDPYRIVRALEILRSSSTNATLSSIRARFESQRPQAIFESIKIGLKVPRDMLRERVINRTQQMLRSGLIEEVESLCAQGLSEWAPLKSVGYAEVQMMLNGEIARAELEDRIVTSTMQLAKRQMTWFKRDADVRWVDASRLDLTLAEALTKLRP